MYKCNYCDYISNKKYNITLHSDIKHRCSLQEIKEENNIKNYTNKCKECNKIFSTKGNLKRHYETCKGNISPYKCQKCNKVFSTTSNKLRHLKICKEEDIDNTSIINNNITNNIITNNNNITINNNNTNNIINNTYIFQSNPNVHPLAYQNYNMQQLSNNVINPNKNNLQLMMEEFGRLIYNDIKNKNIKKTSNKSKFCLVKNEKGDWCNKLDKDIIPKATKDIAFNFRIIIDDNEIELCNIDKKNKCILPKLTEFLNLIIDYNHELDIFNDTDKEDNKIFSDMKDRTICIIIDSSKYK